MPVPMPERIQVGPFAFRVTTDPSEVAKMRHDADDGRYAQTNMSHLKIIVDSDFPPDQVRDSILHEVLHALIWTTGRWQKGMTEETAIQKISSMLLDTLRRNPELVAFLTDHDEPPCLRM